MIVPNSQPALQVPPPPAHPLKVLRPQTTPSQVSPPQPLLPQAGSPRVQTPQTPLTLGLPEQSNPQPPTQDVTAQAIQKSNNRKKTTRPGRGRNLRNSKGKAQPTGNIDIVNWAASDSVSGRSWEFPSNTTFESFWRTIGAEEGDIWWYQGAGMKEVALSVKDEFNTMRDIALSSWTQDHSYLQIRKAVKEDFVEDN
jgi:hypothetical protein